MRIWSVQRRLLIGRKIAAFYFFVWCVVHGAATASQRSISWWWAPPASPTDPAVDAAIEFCSLHKNIVTTVIARCGILTCVRNTSTSRPDARCLNNNGTGGTIVGNMSAACTYALPKLQSLGIRTELWLGEDDSFLSALHLFNHPNETAEALIDVSRRYPGIINGFNYDPEPGAPNINQSTIEDFRHFLGNVTARLNEYDLRFSVDVGCQAPEKVNTSWNPLTGQCALLASSGVNRVMNMGTYNAHSYEEWVYSNLAPALDAHQTEKIGAGLGCWIDQRTNGTWSVTSESAKERICMLMNHSFQEIDMFVLKQGQEDPQSNFPEPFWIEQLELFMGGGGATLSTLNALLAPTQQWDRQIAGHPAAMHLTAAYPLLTVAMV